MWGETCRQSTILLHLVLVFVVYRALRIPWYDGYCTKRTNEVYYGVALCCHVNPLSDGGLWLQFCC